MHMRRIICFCAVLGQAATTHAATFGYVERFNTPGTSGWSNAMGVDNLGTGGVEGDADGYLLIVNEFAGNLGARSTTAVYVGNWTTAGITQVSFYLNDVGGDDNLSFHLMITDSFGTTWQHNQGFDPPHQSWQEYTVNLTNSAEWTRTRGLGSFAQVLTNMSVLHFRHDLPPYGASPDPIAADIGIDSIKLGPDCNGNGIPDPSEPNPDGDGIPAGCDNCPDTANADQEDGDGDGVGDACDLCPGTVPGASVDADGCPAEIAGDFDGDGDVDLTDFAVLRDCTTGPMVAQTLPGCEAAKLDADEDVDHDDFGVFQRCYRGEDIAADPACSAE